jgi:hypothetical protein
LLKQIQLVWVSLFTTYITMETTNNEKGKHNEIKDL